MNWTVFVISLLATFVVSWSVIAWVTARLRRRRLDEFMAEQRRQLREQRDRENAEHERLAFDRQRQRRLH